MTDLEIDLLLGQTPCVCGNVQTWHPECYKGMSVYQINCAYRKTRDEIRRYFAKNRRAILKGVLKHMRSTPQSGRD